MTESKKQYNAAEVEDKWYAHWESKGYFKSVPDDREAFSIVIPPPNVTGVLHMGHMLNNTIQDVLIRKAKLDGKNTCWVPGTDHASIATEAKVVRKLREQGIKKSDLTREEYLKHAWEWTDEYGGIILKQLRKLGAACDWDRTAFTMDEIRSKHVLKAFVDLYNSDKLYRGLRMVNWDPEAMTVLSNEEVLHSEEQARLYHVRYKVKDSDEYVTIATQRPETIMGDTAVAVNPDDPRYAHLKGKTVIVPLVNREVPLIFDDYVDLEFGTGALKVTPAHDPNDYEIGKRHNLEVIDTLNDNGTLSEAAQIHVGLDRFEARKKMKASLEEVDALVEIEDYKTSIGRSERTNAVVEPKLSLQWYVNMQTITEPALKAVMEDEVEFFPKKYKNMYSSWQKNIRDWCISRQLWWGHQIPAWYYEDKVFVAETAEEALEQAQKELGPWIQMEELRQDEDVLDTWFSSWLWPISVFNGFDDKTELDYYYPTSVLVTGWDIINLWVARMVMSGYEWQKARPFEHVYFTGMVRDQQRRKMSKSLGNSPDALKLLADYGADGVRYGMLSCSPAGGDLLFDEKLCETGSKFCNKIWNAQKYIQSIKVSDSLEPTDSDELVMEWLGHALNKLRTQQESDFKQYRLSEALVSSYSFIWNDFFSWYIEIVKPSSGGEMSRKTYDQTIDYFESLMTLLHPFMPFITEEVWHNLRDRKEGDDCMISIPEAPGSHDEQVLTQFKALTDLVSSVRDIRNKNEMGMKDPIDLKVEETDSAKELLNKKGAQDLVVKMANIGTFSFTTDEEKGAVSFLSNNEKYFAHLNKEIDTEAEIDRLQKELEYEKGFVASVEKKLSNDRFVNNAPAAVVDKERKKMADGKDRIRILEENLASLK